MPAVSLSRIQIIFLLRLLDTRNPGCVLVSDSMGALRRELGR